MLILLIATGPFGKGLEKYLWYTVVTMSQCPSSREPSFSFNHWALGMCRNWERLWLPFVATQVGFLCARTLVFPVVSIKEYFSRLPIYFIPRDPVIKLVPPQTPEGIAGLSRMPMFLSLMFSQCVSALCDLPGSIVRRRVSRLHITHSL